MSQLFTCAGVLQLLPFSLLPLSLRKKEKQSLASRSLFFALPRWCPVPSRRLLRENTLTSCPPPPPRLRRVRSLSRSTLTLLRVKAARLRRRGAVSNAEGRRSGRFRPQLWRGCTVHAWRQTLGPPTLWREASFWVELEDVGTEPCRPPLGVCPPRLAAGCLCG